MMIDRRLMLTGLAGALVTLSGCMTKPLRPVNADGIYCHRMGKAPRRRYTCTPHPVPSDAVEAEAKRFEADPAALTVYVVRKRWGDAGAVLPVAVDERQVEAATIPVSLVRFRLSPGAHRLSFVWEGRRSDTIVEGVAGDVRFVELIGSEWAWGTTFEWAAADPESAKRRGEASKLVADVDLRGS